MTPAPPLTRAALAATIDHTLLKAEATPAQVEQLCREAIENGFASVCLHPCYVPLAARLLDGQASVVCTVVGFPLGANQTAIKVAETRRALDDGATEVDMVIRLGAALAGDLDTVMADIEAVLAACRQGRPDALLKVIYETALLGEAVKIELARRSAAAGVDFLKTSTGLHAAGGATLADVTLLAQHGRPSRVKAAGGIRTLADARAMIAAGADRLGCSAGLAILAELPE